MRKKDDAFSKFIEYKALVEKETDKKVKELRSNNGCEYVTNEFKKLCVKRHSMRVDNTPEPIIEWGN